MFLLWRKYHQLTLNQIELVKQGGASTLEDSGWFKCDEWIVKDLQLERPIDHSTHVLEIGCGSEALSQMLHKLTGCNITPLDNHESALELAQLLLKDKNMHGIVIRGNAFALPFESATFDLVHSTGLIEHFDAELIKDQLREARRVLKPGGKLFISIPNFFSPHLVYLWLKGGKHTGRYISNAHFKKLVKQSGFAMNRVGKTSFVMPIIMHNRSSSFPYELDPLLCKSLKPSDTCVVASSRTIHSRAGQLAKMFWVGTPRITRYLTRASPSVARAVLMAAP